MIYFISGHRDLTWEEFAKWYAPAISRTLSTDNGAMFVVAECDGADRMAQDYLLANHNIPTIGGYTSDLQRDEAMILLLSVRVEKPLELLKTF